MKIDILFEDTQILVVNKPAGLSALPEGWDKSAPNLLKILTIDHGRLWIVHRLDKTTSGVMLFARNASSHRSMNRQFEKHEISKIYHAILVGKPNWEEMKSFQPLRINSGHSHRTVVDPSLGKKAETNFKVLFAVGKYSLVEVSPKSGRTHQIRAHAAALGFPILGDKLYGSPATHLIKRPALHAKTINFSHPGTGQIVEISAPYPDDFADAIENLQFEV